MFGVIDRHLPVLIKAEDGTVRKLDGWAEPPPFPVLSGKYSPAGLAPAKFESWQKALAYAGKQLRLFRANRPDDDASRSRARVHTAEWDDVVKGDQAGFPLGALGLPVQYQDKRTQRRFTVNAVNPVGAGPEELRRASPLWLRAVGSENSWGLLTFAFQARFLPGSETTRVYLFPEDELYVDQDDITSLTGQWLAAMRNGRDFTKVIRS